MRSILVTGGSGFIGSNFLHFVLARRPDWRIVNLDSLSYSGNRENHAGLEGDPRFRFVHGDINDRALVDELMRECEAVVHFAAESHVDRSILDPRPFIETNVLGTQTLLESLRRAGGRRFLHVSTDEVYGSLPLGDPESRFSEETPLNPHSPYSASKAASDMIALSYQHTFGLDVLVTRCSNNFGPYQFPEKVIPLFVTNLIDGEPVPLYGDGLNVRDWLHVEDHCEALLAVLERGKGGRVYNIGGSNERSNLELTHLVLDIMGRGREMIRPVADRPGHDRRYAIDARRIRSELGWAPSRSAWPQALAATIQWYVDNERWWRRIKSGEYRTYYALQYGAR
ncbi:MAG: dTDP-glucose 4,6-dehydratase [Gammaproteobacteria bacterium]|nr:dTDP-glucose 4,6-dehydratase [Gammaproteobacteria bacterium]MBI5616511.1 dTDP-glucose 4,6-dehydratase [Gammaproteobacteria bacterium]